MQQRQAINHDLVRLTFSTERMAARTTEFISKMKFIESKLTTRSAETNYEKIVHCFIFAMCFVISLHGKPLESKCRFTKLCIMVKENGMVMAK